MTDYFAELKRDLAQVGESRLANANPIQFGLIQSCLAISVKTDAQRKLLREKVSALVKDVLQRFEILEDQAASNLKEILEGWPDKEQTAIALKDEGRFNELWLLKAELNKEKKLADQKSLLGSLIKSVDVRENRKSQSTSKLANMSLHKRLDRQRFELLLEAGFSDEGTSSQVRQMEMMASEVFRDSQRQADAVRVLSRSIHEAPDNAGPHNPHMLMIQILRKVQQLSPKYAKRLVSNYEALLVLERNRAKLKHNNN